MVIFLAATRYAVFVVSVGPMDMHSLAQLASIPRRKKPRQNWQAVSIISGRTLWCPSSCCGHAHRLPAIWVGMIWGTVLTGLGDCAVKDVVAGTEFTYRFLAGVGLCDTFVFAVLSLKFSVRPPAWVT